jgi:DNA-directed RNA polymerase specialized sigma24 family protein
MTDEEVIKQLEKYAKAVARRVLQRFKRANDDFRHEEITQSLLLEGWKVWKDTGNDGLARHRISTRATNETQKLADELGEWKTVTDIRPRAGPTAQAESADAHEKYDAAMVDPGYRRISVGQVGRQSPEEDKMVQEYLNGLPEDERKIAMARAAEMDIEEISEVTGLSRSTVQRKLRAMRKELKNDDAE